MESRGWREHADESETQDYVHQESRQIIRDAHPGNWIKQRGTAELIPVDISIEKF
jgi:CRISPR/Cas system CSM-associated protein Csm3 (group 7 of RAMP superfamily)